VPPGRFLSEAETERLGAFPDAIERRDVVRFFSLAGEDLAFVRAQRGAANQLGIALQLGALRWLGFVPEDLPGAPPEALAALGAALDVQPRAIFDYAVRAPTRVEHRMLVRAHAGFRPFTERELDALRVRLIEEALEHERPSLLLARICELLRREQIERPSIDRLVRLVGWARERAHEQTFQRLAPQFTEAIRAKLDGLLVTDGGQCQHAWLRSRPTSVSARALRHELDKRAFLLGELGAGRFDLCALPPNRRAWLAQTGRQQTNQALARMAPERRYPVLVCFCVEALERATDDAIEIYDRALGAADRAAQRKREELERRGRRDIQTTVSRFIDLSTVVLEAHDSGTDILRLIERRIGIDGLREDLGRAQGIARPQPTGHLDLLSTDGAAAARKLLAAVITSLELRPTGVDEDELLAALRLIRQLGDDKRCWLPGFSPSAFIDAHWRPHIVDSSRGRLDRRAYELCAAYELRSALRAGRAWVLGSRRHADPSSLDALAGEQAELLKSLARERDATAEAQLADGDLVVDAAETADERRLRKLIEPRLPEVDLPELLIEVDGWTGFTNHLTPLSGNRRRSAEMPCVLYAAILAQATNLGLSGMARASEFSYQQLEWAWEQLCREDTLTAASATLVDYHHGLPLAQEWGAGRLSSSDGQRFAARTRGPGVAALPRYFGHRRRGSAGLLVDLRPVQPVRQQGRDRDGPRRHAHARRDPRQPDGAADRGAHDRHARLYGYVDSWLCQGSTASVFCWVDRFAELVEKVREARGGAAVAVDLAWPASLLGVFGETQLGLAAGAESRGVLGCRDELGAGEVEVALAGAFARQAQAVSEFELGFEEVGLQPIDRGAGELAGFECGGAGSGDRGAGAEHGLVVAEDLGVADLGVDE
jgi:Domain of unknown function (DUF4158)/Tn3 transposase DDE domain